jgi:uncharacterized membrane protein YgcG
MKHRGNGVNTIKMACAAAATLLSTTAFAGVPGWTISESSGAVSVVSGGAARVSTRAASRGTVLAAGDIVATGAKGRAVIIRGQEYLVVSPNSRIRVADPSRGGGMTQIIEQNGNVIYKIKKMSTPHFAVETPFLAAVVKGTTFSVTVTESGASVQVIEGRVEVATNDGGARFLILPGDIGSVSAGALGKLNVQGRENRTIISPHDGAQSSAPTAELLKADPVDAVALQSDTVIDKQVSEPPVKLASVTNGMVSGGLAQAVVVIPPPPPPPATVDLPEAPGDKTPVEIVIVALPPTPATGVAGPGDVVIQAPPPVVESILVALPPTPTPPSNSNSGSGNSRSSGSSNSGNSGSGNSGSNSGNGGSNSGSGSNGSDTPDTGPGHNNGDNSGGRGRPNN